MGLPLQTFSYYDNSGGNDLLSSPTKVQDDMSSGSRNVDYTVDGAVVTRFGSSIMNQTAGLPAQMSGAPTTLGLFDYRNSDGTIVQVVNAGTAIKHSLTTPVDVVTGLSATNPSTGGLAFSDMEFQVTENEELMVWGNGIDTDLKFDGTIYTNLSLPRPTAPTLADGGAGSLVAGDYYYYVVFARTIAGVVVQVGETSPISSVITIAASHRITVTIPVCTETLATGVTAQCNARLIYRISPTSSGVAYRIATVTDNTTTSYDDNNPTDGTIEAEFDNQAAPKSAIFEEYFGRMYFVDADRPTDVYTSKANAPFNVPSVNLTIFDGPVNCIVRLYGAIIFSTSAGTLWVQNGDFGTAPVRISSKIGILNNRCLVGEGTGYFLGTNLRFYQMNPTDFSQAEIRISNDLSIVISPALSDIVKNKTDRISMEFFTVEDIAKVYISCPTQANTNDTLIIYNESQSTLKQKPCWQIWDNINASVLKQFNVDGTLGLYSGDYNGFLWHLEDSDTYGDGAQENGIATSATSTTLTDSTQTWTVNKFIGVPIQIVSGTGAGQRRTITANTGTQVTVATWSTTPDLTSVYTVGGYDAYHFTNWKSVTGSYDTLKQLWFIMSNLNALGDYDINCILQFDFDTSLTNQTALNVSLASSNSIWGAFIWGTGIWGSQEVFQSRIREFARFRAIRFGFRIFAAGQPFQLNGFSMSVQDKGLFWPSAA